MRFENRLEFASCTDSGLVRSQNEDSLVFDASNGFALLADGMGGYNAGEVASELAVTLVAEGLQSGLPALRQAQAAGDDALADIALLLRQKIDNANIQIFRKSITQPELAGMGTTLLALVFCDKQAVVAHIGDSRLYCLHGQRLRQLTYDHTVLQARIDSGEITPEQAKRVPHKGMLTRALGVEAAVETELRGIDVAPGDIFLLCSDGLSDMLEGKEIQQVLSEAGGNLPATAQRLVKMANENGGFDNISVVLVRVR